MLLLHQAHANEDIIYGSIFDDAIMQRIHTVPNAPKIAVILTARDFQPIKASKPSWSLSLETVCKVTGLCIYARGSTNSL